MSDNQNGGDDSELKPWRRRLERMLALGRIQKALELLDEIINERQLDLFESEDSLSSQRRLAWLYRIDLLRSVGRLREALAWTCLECEIQPQNVTAQALKARLKRELKLSPMPPSSDARPEQTYETIDDLWRGVAGMRELKAVLNRDVILPLLEPELYAQYRVSLPNRIVLYGPPGCGKTFIARKIAEILGFHFIEVKPSDVASTYVHGTQEKLGKLFDDARRNAPCVLFFDELDALVPSRTVGLLHHYAAEVNEFLSQLNEAAKSRLLVLGATNRLEKVDDAVLRPGRFDRKVFVGPPDLEARMELLRLYLADRPQETIDLVKAARECEGFTSAELQHVVEDSARRALGNRRLICYDDVIASLAANPPAYADGTATNRQNSPD